jgi:hypothetical protein
VKNTVRTAVLATLVAAGTLGLAGTAAASTGPDLCDPATIDAHGMCHMDASGPFSDIEVSFPAHSVARPAIERYIDSVIDDYHRDGPSPTSPQSLQITGTDFAGPHSHSVVLDVYQNLSGAAHPAVWYKSFTTDATTSAPISFGDLFRSGTTPLTRIAPIVEKDLGRQWGQPVTIPAETLQDPANFGDFAITDDAVVFFFDKDELLPATGDAQVSVPRSAIADLLAPGR